MTKKEKALEMWAKVVTTNWHRAADKVIDLKDYANKLAVELTQEIEDEEKLAKRQQAYADVIMELDDLTEIFEGLALDFENASVGGKHYRKVVMLVVDGNTQVRLP